MTRKDFQLIADAIAATANAYRDAYTTTGAPLAAMNALELHTERMADALATTNPRFDRARFVAACTFPEA